MRHALIALVCAGCSQVFGLDRPIRALGDGGGDARGDSGPLGDGASCYGSSLVQVCFASPPSGAVTPIDTINTDVDASCSATANTSAWCVIAGNAITFSSPTKVRGSRPLVVVSTGTIAVESALDVASHRGSPAGAGADPAGCPLLTMGTVDGGGAGGSFGGMGGAGNAGGDPAAPVMQVTALQGGCPGSDGGSSPGSGGHGGGAIYLIAVNSITVTAAGSIDASGEGGAGGTATNGGAGGGGSGGFVGFEAPLVTVAGQVYANGGGGGEGADSQSGNAGADPISASIAAAGGNGATQKGGSGGSGSAGSIKTGGTGMIGGAPAGGGGGGGGAGVVWVIGAAIMNTGAVSPPPT